MNMKIFLKIIKQKFHRPLGNKMNHLDRRLIKMHLIKLKDIIQYRDYQLYKINKKESH